MKTVVVGNKKIGKGCPVFIIAEIGINHNGSVEIAKLLIDMATRSGCDAVKFQKRTVDVVYTKEELAKPRENPFGNTNGDLKRGLEFNKEQYKEIDGYCKEKGIIWFASPWDEKSVDFLEYFNLPCYKIASASLTDGNLLKYIKSKGRPIILSTGMSNLEQVKKAVKILGEKNLIILSCVSTYPSKDEELNLKVISTLKNEFPNIPVGYSGHEHGTTMSVCAVAMGACMVERHITIDRTMWGSDQAASLEGTGLKLMIGNIRRLEKAMGMGDKNVLDSEKPILEKLRRVKDF